ncbi:AlpA family phage regulatory protein [Herbaspirillum sp. C7C8]|uniref:helix-turn-helix transcriptional regulator n=1 Tax=Herbaspirillum sp. C7C8 TaxID=2736665 RepID=UPI001F522F6F|nr:AlpA family phage regulatory protein [Herbaspirillum sp. C7C8]MCI1005188.1 AlpA family phage regulatory protein [Herbaspirillum sp. C7C8]
MAARTQHDEDALLRLPAVLNLIPVGRSTWYAGINDGRYPEPVRLGRRCVAWRMRDIQKVLNQGGAGLN